MNSKTLVSLAGIVLALGAALYNWKFGTPSADSTTSSANSSLGTATQESHAAPSKAPEPTTANPVSKAAPTKPTPSEATAPQKSPEAKSPAVNSKPAAPLNSTSNVGFGSERSFDEHYEKHGSEFGSISQLEYLALAQKLRDAPVGGSILEAVRDDGVISRFDKKSGAFLAFNKNKTIRTFFKPNDGVRYYERQIEKAH